MGYWLQIRTSIPDVLEVIICNFRVSKIVPKKFKIFCLNDNIPTILAYSNDVSYDVVFEEQLKNYLEPEDVLIAISGSGNSKNIINAVNYAKSINSKIIGFTGFDGGKLKQLSNVSINANINDMQISEDIHVIVMHMLYKLLENE